MSTPIMPPSDGQWHYEYITAELLQAERVERVIYTGSTAYQEVTIQDTGCFGRTLVLDNKTQSTEVDEFVYHEALVHPSMITHSNPQQVFIAGGGEGATAREVLLYGSVERVVMVDIDREVVNLCKAHMPTFHQGAFDDPRLQLHHLDAQAFLDSTSQRYDVVIIDVPDPLEGGPSYMLFTQEFYLLIADRLRPGGVMVAQSGPTGPAFHRQCFSAVAGTIGSVFPSVSLYETFVPSFGSTWGFVIGSMGSDPAAFSKEEVDIRISDRITGTLRHYDGLTHQGMFSIPKYLREVLASDSRLITKTNPLFVV